MTPLEIRSQMVLHKITNEDIARALGLNSSGVSAVIHRHWMSRRVAAEIARQLGKPVEVVFPEIVSKPVRQYRRR